jgi:DNA-binding NarL/FixJ family response regulator
MALVSEDNAGRVIVVEDFEPFRRMVCSNLAVIPGLRVVAEVSDGIEAVRKAQELQPDLILLDIGLPSLNGIEAARQIRSLSPQSKILFVSQETDVDVVEEALSLGTGYVVKTRVAQDLLRAVEAVRRGGRFVSAGLLGEQVTQSMDLQVPDGLSPQSADD